jgi:hypothetical protein
MIIEPGVKTSARVRELGDGSKEHRHCKCKQKGRQNKEEEGSWFSFQVGLEVQRNIERKGI